MCWGGVAGPRVEPEDDEGKIGIECLRQRARRRWTPAMNAGVTVPGWGRMGGEIGISVSPFTSHPFPSRIPSPLVMAGLDPAIRDFPACTGG